MAFFHWIYGMRCFVTIIRFSCAIQFRFSHDYMLQHRPMEIFKSQFSTEILVKIFEVHDFLRFSMRYSNSMSSFNRLIFRKFFNRILDLSKFVENARIIDEYIIYERETHTKQFWWKNFRLRMKSIWNVLKAQTKLFPSQVLLLILNATNVIRR